MSSQTHITDFWGSYVTSPTEICGGAGVGLLRGGIEHTPIE